MKKLSLLALLFSLTIVGCSNNNTSFDNDDNGPSGSPIEPHTDPSTEPVPDTYIEYKDYKYVDDWFGGGCYILCWQIENNEWRCGPIVANGRYTTFSMVDSLQKYIPSTLEEMRIRVENNYKKESEKYRMYTISHYVAEVPYPVTQEFFSSFKERLDSDRSLGFECKNEYLYDALGLEELYGLYFDDEYKFNLFEINKEDMVNYVDGDSSKYHKDLYGLENYNVNRMVNSSSSNEEAIENAKWAFTTNSESVSSFNVGKSAAVEKETDYYYLLNVTVEYYENKFVEPSVSNLYVISLKEQYCKFYPELVYLNQNLSITFTDFSYIQIYMDIYSLVHQHSCPIYSTTEEKDDAYTYHMFEIHIIHGDWNIPNSANLYHYIWTISKETGRVTFTKTELVRTASYS